MAMGEEKGQEATRQVAMVCLDELVPADDRYRRLDELIDWGFVRECSRPYYAESVGRPSIDPIVLVKLVVAGALEGIDSMRELVRTASLRLDLRRFLGYGFYEHLPAHQTLSHAHTVRFVDGDLFERLFTRSVALCAKHGLLDGTHLSVDGFHAEADAALASLRASLAPTSEPGAMEAPGAESGDQGTAPTPPPAELKLAAPHTGATPKRRSSNSTSVSITDPDARLRGKPGQRPHLVYRGQVAVDPKRRCVVACLGERADSFEGDGLAMVVDRARFLVPELASVGADQGYAAARVWQAAKERGLLAYVPPQRRMLPPHAEPKTEAQAQALAARRRCQSAPGIWAHRRRMADSEGLVSELKNRHALGRARRRGRAAFHVQLLVGSTAVNLKRLASYGGLAAEGWAAGTSSERAAPLAYARPAFYQQNSVWRPVCRSAVLAPSSDELLVWRLNLSLN